MEVLSEARAPIGGLLVRGKSSRAWYIAALAEGTARPANEPQQARSLNGISGYRDPELMRELRASRNHRTTSVGRSTV